ncbi:MAG: dTMP kinase [Candidatus Bathyarchaeia archaeon]|jgi:dTMP kinase
MSEKGMFICVEGLDGSGKTTQAQILTERLGKNYRTVLTAEPSRGKTGTYIRESCLYEENRLPTAAEALLFAADRIEHVENEIKPALEQGKVVICDRYIYSSYAYQGSDGLNLGWIKRINSYALKPDYAVFIDVTPERVLERLRRKKSVMETLQIQRSVREVYLNFVTKGELALINGEGTKDEVADTLFSKVQSFFASRLK